MGTGKPILNLKTTIILLVCGVVAVALLVTNTLISGKVADITQKSLAEKAINIGSVVARSPVVIDGLTGKIDEKSIQTFANDIRRATNVRFIVVMDTKGIRKSHPDITKVGKHFEGGDEYPALKGKEYTSIAKGTLGMSLRAFSPIFASNGQQVGAVAVGISLNNVQQAVAQSRSVIYIGIGLGFLVGLAGAIILAERIKKTLLGLEPYAITKLLEERSAMLQSVREGVLAVDKDSRITLVNAEGIRLFNQAGIFGDMNGKIVEELVPNTRMKDVLETGISELDQELDLSGITLLTNRVPVWVNGEIVGAIATFRDKTEIRQMAEELTGVRIYVEALRAQAHEFMNKLHVTLGMVHMKYYDQLTSYISQIAHQQQTEVGFAVRHIKDPVLAGFILGKLSYAREAGAELVLSEECFLPEPAEPKVIHELVTIIGNLVDNALEAVKDCIHKTIDLTITHNDEILTIEIRDTGLGISEEQKIQMFTKGYSTKAENRGLGLFLVQSSLERLAGKIEVFSEVGKGTTFRVLLPYQSKGEIE